MNITNPRLTTNQLLIDRYRIVSEIGQGGMQQVYLAQDLALNRQIAIKLPINDSAIKRFERSAIVSAMISHPNVAKVLDYSSTTELEFLVEEFIPGSDLQRRLTEDYGRLDCHLVAHVMHHVAKAVGAMNSKAVIHRDLKPSNIMVSNDAGMQDVKVTDFGIATMAQTEINEAVEGGAGSIAASKTVVGALAFMAPELIRKYDGTDRSKCDVWSIGAIIYFLLFHEYPFGQELEAIQRILNGTLPDKTPIIGQINIQFRELYYSLWNIVKSCLQMNPAERPDISEICRLFSGIAYSSEPRNTGVINYINPHSGDWGFITPDDGTNDVFFHFDSYVGGTPQRNIKVIYSPFEGDPRERAFPVAPYSPL